LGEAARNQPAMFEYCRAHVVHITASSPLGWGDRPGRLRGGEDEVILLEGPAAAAIARRRGCASA